MSSGLEVENWKESSMILNRSRGNQFRRGLGDGNVSEGSLKGDIK